MTHPSHRLKSSSLGIKPRSVNVVTAGPNPHVSGLQSEVHLDARRKPDGALSTNLFQLIYTESVSEPWITGIRFRVVYLSGGVGERTGVNGVPANVESQSDGKAHRRNMKKWVSTTENMTTQLTIH